MEDLPHSHNYRESTILQGVAFVIKHMADLPINKNRVIDYRKAIENWLANTTYLSLRTMKEYAKVIEQRSKKEITWA
jgi:hypothetical protein